MTPTVRMLELIKYLPEKDIKLAETFIKTRNFVALKELVDSDLYKIKKAKRKESAYSNSDEELISLLKGEVDSYLDLLGEDITPNGDDETDFDYQLYQV